jgi:hypothetical protein
VFSAEFPQKIWVNYGIGWSEASDANDTAKIRPSKIQKIAFEAVEAAQRHACLLG